MVDLNEGDQLILPREREEYIISKSNGEFVCSCFAYKNSSTYQYEKTCKHIIILRGITKTDLESIIKNENEIDSLKGSIIARGIESESKRTKNNDIVNKNTKNIDNKLIKDICVVLNNSISLINYLSHPYITETVKFRVPSIVWRLTLFGLFLLSLVVALYFIFDMERIVFEFEGGHFFDTVVFTEKLLMILFLILIIIVHLTSFVYKDQTLSVQDKIMLFGGLGVGLAFGLLYGLVVGLAFGLAFGLGVGLVVGLVVGLFGEHDYGLVVGLGGRLVGGLFGGLFVGLGVGLVVGLVVGLSVLSITPFIAVYHGTFLLSFVLYIAIGIRSAKRSKTKVLSRIMVQLVEYMAARSIDCLPYTELLSSSNIAEIYARCKINNNVSAKDLAEDLRNLNEKVDNYQISSGVIQNVRSLSSFTIADDGIYSAWGIKRKNYQDTEISSVEQGMKILNEMQQELEHPMRRRHGRNLRTSNMRYF